MNDQQDAGIALTDLGRHQAARVIYVGVVECDYVEFQSWLSVEAQATRCTARAQQAVGRPHRDRSVAATDPRASPSSSSSPRRWATGKRR